MSQIVNTQYARALRRGKTRPVYLVLFDGIPTRFSTAPVALALGPTLTIIRNLSAGMAQVTVDQGRSSLASALVELLDKNGVITNMAFQYQMGNRKVTIKAGFDGLPESKYVTAYVGRVNNYTLQQDNVTWSFDIVSLMTDTFSAVFNQTATVAADVLIGDTTVTVDSTAGWPAATNGNCYLLIDQEVISFTGITTTTFTGCLRGQLGTTADAHSNGGTISNFIYLYGNPLTIALQILLSTGTGTNGPYDVLPANAGLGIDKSLVNVAQFETMRARWIANWVFQFEEFKSVAGKQFLEEQIYTFCNAYPTIDNNGLLSINVYGPPLPNQINQTLTDAQLAAPPTFTGNVFSTYFFNEVDFSYDYNFLADITNATQNSSTGPYDSRTLYEDANSQAIFNQAATKTWQARGVRTLALGVALINRIPQRFLKRFAVPSPILSARVFYETRLLQQADIVPMTSAKVPNLATGKIGIQNKMLEILGIQPDFINGCQTLTLLDTGYSYGRKYGAISPSPQAPINFPVWSAATSAQRLYAFISSKVNATKGVMSDGSDGYYITP